MRRCAVADGRQYRGAAVVGGDGARPAGRTLSGRPLPTIVLRGARADALGRLLPVTGIPG